MSTDTQNFVLEQSNGEQGATSYGPRLRNKGSASSHRNNDFVRTLEIQLDGSVQTEQVLDPRNETQWALPAGTLILDVFVHSETGASALGMGVEDLSGAGGLGNLFAAGTAVGGAWTAVRDLDINTTDTSQIVFAGLDLDETATVLITYLQTPQTGGEDGVLTKPRVVPA